MNDNHSPHLDFVRTFWVSFILTVVVGPGLERPFFGDGHLRRIKGEGFVTGGTPCPLSSMCPVISRNRRYRRHLKAFRRFLPHAKDIISGIFNTAVRDRHEALLFVGVSLARP